MLRGGIAGCGAVITTTHMPGWRALKDVEIVAVCDQREEVARAVARRWGVPAAYGDLSQMLSSEKLDFVDICTPPLTHCQLAMQAMEARLHVLVEKPMATMLSEADEMVATAREYGVKLCVIHNILFSPVVQKAKSLIDTGAIGELEAYLASMRLTRHTCYWRFSTISAQFAPSPGSTVDFPGWQLMN